MVQRPLAASLLGLQKQSLSPGSQLNQQTLSTVQRPGVCAARGSRPGRLVWPLSQKLTAALHSESLPPLSHGVHVSPGPIKTTNHSRLGEAACNSETLFPSEAWQTWGVRAPTVLLGDSAHTGRKNRWDLLLTGGLEAEKRCLQIQGSSHAYMQGLTGLARNRTGHSL